MPGRMFTTQNYRYGLNGQEKDDEINGIAGAYTSAEFWEYDTRLGRRWNRDPIVKSWESSYATFADNPIFYNDPSGLSPGDPVKKDDGKGAKGETAANGGTKNGDGSVAGGEPQCIGCGANGETIYGLPEESKVSETPSVDYGAPTIDYSTPSSAEIRDATMQGVVNAAYSNTMFGIGRTDPRKISDNYDIRMAYAKGQLYGDALTAIQATIEMSAGEGMVTGGLTEAAVTWEFGGVPAAPGLVVAGVGVLVTGHGASVIAASTAGTITTTIIVTQMAANNYEDTDGSDGETPNYEKMKQGNNSKKNQEAQSLYKEYKLNKKQQRDLHDRITKQGYDRKQIEAVIREYLGLD